MNKMNKFALALLLILAALPVHADSVRFTRIGGYAPLGVSDTRTDLGVIQGEAFKKIKGQIQNIVTALVKHERWMPKEAVWWDVGPDAEYISAVVEMDGKTYTINSWYPVERQSPGIAVSETQGLVPVKSQKAKEDVEFKNSATYRQIVAIFDLMPQRPQK